MTCEVTYERLAAFAAGDLDAGGEAEMRQHVGGCARCRERLEALRNADAALAALPPVEPPAATVLTVRRLLAEATREAATREIMTLDEVAEFLRVAPEQLGEVVEELPAFELAGQVRVRRERLIEWIGQRERAYARHTAASWVARAVATPFSTGGVR